MLKKEQIRGWKGHSWAQKFTHLINAQKQILTALQTNKNFPMKPVKSSMSMHGVSTRNTPTAQVQPKSSCATCSIVKASVTVLHLSSGIMG